VRCQDTISFFGAGVVIQLLLLLLLIERFVGSLFRDHIIQQDTIGRIVRTMPVDDTDNRSNAMLDEKIPIELSKTLPSSKTAQLNKNIDDAAPLETKASCSRNVCSTSPYFFKALYPVCTTCA
jgi:hypothetical protein